MRAYRGQDSRQLFVPSLRCHAPFVHHDYLVCPHDRRKPVGNHHERLSRHEPADGALHRRLALGVGVCRRLVQNHHVGVLQDRPRNRDALALPAGKPCAGLARRRAVALRQTFDEVVGTCGARGHLHLDVRRLRPAHADVVRDRRIEQKRVLGHVGDMLHELIEGDVAHVAPAVANRAAAGVPEPGHQLRHGGFAGAGRSDDRRHGARFRVEGHAMEHLGALVVGERHVLEGERLARQLDPLRRTGQLGRSQEVPDHVQTRIHPRDLARRLRELENAPDEAQRDGDAHHEGGKPDLACREEQDPQRKREQQRAGNDGPHKRHPHPALTEPGERGVVIGGHGLGERAVR